MSDIIINTTAIKSFAALNELSEMLDIGDTERDYLWDALGQNEDFMYEFVYYLEHGTIKDNIRVEGYSLTDLYVDRLQHFNLYVADIGKNSGECDKDRIVLETFIIMAGLIKEPESTLEKLTKEKGMDKGFF